MADAGCSTKGHARRAVHVRGLCRSCYQLWYRTDRDALEGEVRSLARKAASTSDVLERLHLVQQRLDVEARLAAIPTPDPPWQPLREGQTEHTCGDHEPSRTCYVASKCRCGQCRRFNREYNVDRDRQIAYGRWGERLQPATEVVAHLKRLQAAGLGLRRISKLSGVSRSSLQKLTSSQRKAITSATAEALLAIEVPAGPSATARQVAATALVDAGTARQQLAELADLGFTRTELARYITGRVDASPLRVPRQVTARRAAVIARLHRHAVAGAIVARGPQKPGTYGPASPIPATPASGEPTQGRRSGPACEECGEASLAGGRWCLRCFQAHAAPRKPTGCGTDAGYAAHRRADTDPCSSCREAHATANAQRKVG